MSFFEFIIELYKSKSLVDLYESIADFVRYSDYSLTEVENMIPYEMEIYSSILLKQLKEEKKRAKNSGK